MDFDVVPYEDITWGVKLGAGSFGSVYKGSYLGIDIAIKEVLPSTEYDVHKYFEREWRIMRECRHPNIVQFLGLSRAPAEDGRIFIISEYLPRGNLRSFILKHSLPFPWRLRISFATDVARALAYLHARQCIHRDLKGENLLITSNERIKVTDFGFARIASRSAEEMRRMTYCGTDGYMSPEILLGHDFDLPTDVFSLGIIFIEILSRRMVDSRTYVRTAPDFTLDSEEVIKKASPGCPPAFISLALACCAGDPGSRPLMPQILQALRSIEVEILNRLGDEDGEHVGSVKLLGVGGGKRAIPDFSKPPNVDSEDDEDLTRLEALDVDGDGADPEGTWRTARWEESRPSVLSMYHDASEMRGHEPLLAPPSEVSDSALTISQQSVYSTDVIRGKPFATDSELQAATPYEDSSSTMTVKAGETGEGDGRVAIDAQQTSVSNAEKAEGSQRAAAPTLRTHRFTLVGKASTSFAATPRKSTSFGSSLAMAFFSPGSSNKCAVCHKRVGQRPSLQCDDCNTTVHVKCSHAAERNCVEASAVLL